MIFDPEGAGLPEVRLIYEVHGVIFYNMAILETTAVTTSYLHNIYIIILFE
jgi:hypothetical protein